MNLGSLVGYLGLDTSNFDKGLSGSESALGSFASRSAAKAAAAGVAIAGALGGGLVGAMNVEKANDKLSAQLGAGSPLAESAGKVAGQLYANAYGESLTEVNEAVRAVLQGGLLPEDATNAQIESITGRVLDLSTTFDQDLGGTTRAVGQMIRTGLATDATQALDILTRGFQQGNDKAGDLLDTTNEYGTQFRKLGLDGTASMGLISQAIRAGARDSDVAADALKEFSIRAVDGSKLTAEGFQMVGLNAGDMAAAIAAGGPTASAALGQTLDGLRAIEDPALRSQAAVALFGTQAEDLGDALYAMDTSTAVQQMGNVEGAADRMGAALNDNAATNIESFKRQATQAFVDVIGGQVLPKVSEFASALATQFGPAVSAAAGFLSGTLLPAVQGVFGFLQQHQTTVTVIAGLIGTVLVAAFAVWAARAVAAAATNTVAWFTTATASSASAAVQQRSALQVVTGWILMGAQALIQGIKIASVWTAQIIASAAAGAASFAVSAARVVAGWVLMGVQSLIQAARMAAAWLIAMGPVGWVIATVVALVALIIANWDKVSSWTSKAWSAVTSFISSAWNTITGTVARAAAAVWGAIQSAWNSVQSATSSAWNAVKSTVSNAINNVVSFVAGLPGRAVSALSSLGSLITGVASRAWSSFSSAVSSGISNAISFIAGLPGRAVSALGSVGSLLTSAGADLIRGFVSGIKNMAGNVASAALDAAKSAVNSVKSFLGIASPSKVFAGIGENVGEGFVNGIAGMQPAVAAQMAALADTQALESLRVPTFTAPPVGSASSYRAGAGAVAVGSAAAGDRVTRIEVDARGLGADAIARAIERKQRQRDALASRRG